MNRATRGGTAPPILLAFVALAVIVRVVFWAFTHRVWEDALITLTVARNAWEGYGLTHHASEPPSAASAWPDQVR